MREFWNSLQSKLLSEGLYTTSIGGMKLRLQELQAKDEQVQKAIAGHSEGWDNINEVFYHQVLSYVPEITQTELISRHHDDLLAGYVGIKKTDELIAQKYY